MSKWQLPEGIEELVGSQAESFEKIRRSLLDLYKSYGYELAIPPIVDYVDILELNSKSINKKTFKFLDPFSNKMLGVRSDNTPQISRIDSREKELDSINRYCYINSILRTKTDDFYASRSSIQAGAELYGFAGIQADIEIIEIMISSVFTIGIKNLTLSLGDSSIFNKLTELSELDSEQIQVLKNIFKRKSIPDLDDFLKKNNVIGADRFKFLISLAGDVGVLEKAKQYFSDIAEIIESINSLINLSIYFTNLDINIMFDIGELKAYDYHNGLIFALYNSDFSKSLAQGGRYNSLIYNEKTRSATGFSMDLKFLMQQKLYSNINKDKILIAPNNNDKALKKFVTNLRQKGFIVKTDMKNLSKADIVKSNNKWMIKN